MISMRTQILLRLEEDLLERVDKIRGDIPRSRWLVRLIESGLSSESPSAPQISTATTPRPKAISGDSSSKPKAISNDTEEPKRMTREEQGRVNRCPHPITRRVNNNFCAQCQEYVK